jgi:GNAT superfamily N-acetyltransferase
VTAVPDRGFSVRPASPSDADPVAVVARRSREAAMPWLPDLHTPDEDLAFFASQLATHHAWVALVDGRVAGFGIAGEGWLHHLYVEPQLRGRGLGSALLVEAKQVYPVGLYLWVFERNHAARSFYAARGFVDVKRTDGSGNEEKEPDVLMRWPSAADL